MSWAQSPVRENARPPRLGSGCSARRTAENRVSILWLFRFGATRTVPIDPRSSIP